MEQNRIKISELDSIIIDSIAYPWFWETSFRN
jgi:hypothetical protein